MAAPSALTCGTWKAAGQVRMDALMSRAAVVVNPTKLDDDEAFRKSVRRVMGDHPVSPWPGHLGP